MATAKVLASRPANHPHYWKRAHDDFQRFTSQVRSLSRNLLVPSLQPFLARALTPLIHDRFKEWSSRQGPIYSLKVFNTTLIVLNCPRAIHALFTKKSALFTDRPADAQWELACHNEQLALMRSGPEWKALRKLAMQGVANPRALDGVIADILENEVRLLMGEFLDAGDEWRDRLAKFGISVAGAVIYGQRAPDWDCFWAKVRSTRIPEELGVRIQS